MLNLLTKKPTPVFPRNGDDDPQAPDHSHVAGGIQDLTDGWPPLIWEGPAEAYRYQLEVALVAADGSSITPPVFTATPYADHVCVPHPDPSKTGRMLCTITSTQHDPFLHGNYRWRVRYVTEENQGNLPNAPWFPINASDTDWVVAAAVLKTPAGTVETPQPAYSWEAIDARTERALLTVKGVARTTDMAVTIEALQQPSPYIASGIKLVTASEQWIDPPSSGDTWQSLQDTPLLNGDYVWYLRQWNPAYIGPFGAYSTVNAFRLIQPGSLLAPSGVVLAGSNTLTFRWREVNLMDEYRIAILNSSGGAVATLTPEFACSEGICEATASLSLPAGAYKWTLSSFWHTESEFHTIESRPWDYVFSQNFQTINPTLTVSKSGAGSGTVTSAPAGIACGADCTETYLPNTQVTLTAAAASGSIFTGWSGACVGTGTCTVTMTDHAAVTATFLPTRTIEGYVRNSGGTGIASVTMTGVPGTPATNANGLYTAVVPLGWSGTVRPQREGFVFNPAERVYSNVQTNLASQNYTATRQYALTVVLAGAGTGAVTSSPAGIACGSDCTNVYNTGTVVTLTATPAVGSKLSAWSGGGCSGAGACKVTVNAAKTVTATFVPATVTLSGYVRNSTSTGLAGVVMSGLPGAPVTGTNGAYSVTLPRGWSGVVTPQKSGYAMTPVSRSYASVVANTTGQNYTWKQATVSAIRTLGPQLTSFSNLSTLPPVVPSDPSETPMPAAVPEPATFGLFGLGVACLVYLLRRPRRQR